jgi:hypothetical protein
MTDDGEPIAYTALERDVPVVSRSGRRFGTVERVLEVPDAGILHGIVVTTPDGLRFVDRDHLEQLTTTRVRCSLDDEQVAGLPLAVINSSSPDGEVDFSPVRPFRPGISVGGFSAGVVIVRCARGGLFEDLWIPMASLKAIRLGPFRIQRCPVHNRVEIVQQVDPATLTDAELAQAARYPAGRIP